MTVINVDDQTLKQLLITQGYASEQDLTKTEQDAQQNHSSLVDEILKQNLLTKDLLGQAIAEAISVPYADLETNPPDDQTLQIIPDDIAKQYRIVIFKQNNNQLQVATDNPQLPELPNVLNQLFPNTSITLTYSLPDQIDGVLRRYQKPLDTRFNKIIQSSKRVAPEILDEIFADAIGFHASDIHLEPNEENVLVRFRIDGVLHEAGRIPSNVYSNMLNRLKVLAHMRIDEHQSTQDGSLRFQNENQTIDVRISIIPSLDGEKIVMRVLSNYVDTLSFTDLGISPPHQKLLNQAIQKPFGMIVVAGPTGSGKSTTLYAVVKLLNKTNINITTIEDPVEYRVKGINQIQVNNQTNVTFANGLRAIVRQDPDIILVGEIRDQETAEISVNAALTGHLLLSTFHANDAATAIPRILDMGVEPFLLASTLELIISQRLVRRICQSCRYSYQAKADSDLNDYPQDVKKYFPKTKPFTLYQGKGCNVCNHTGYKGRIAIMEMIPMTPEIKEVILTHPSTAQIWKVARKAGAITLFEDGIEKTKTGVTTLSEIVRVASPTQY